MRRPWNIINLPIYSLQTVDSNGKLNMNICTYVSVVSMKPKIYSIAIYSLFNSISHWVITASTI